MLMAHDGGLLQAASVRIDGSGSQEFQRALGAYLRRELGHRIKDVKMSDSARDPLMQLADMCIGAIARTPHRQYLAVQIEVHAQRKSPSRGFYLAIPRPSCRNLQQELRTEPIRCVGATCFIPLLESVNASVRLCEHGQGLMDNGLS